MKNEESKQNRISLLLRRSYKCTVTQVPHECEQDLQNVITTICEAMFAKHRAQCRNYEWPELSAYDKTSQQRRENERSHIFKQFSGSMMQDNQTCAVLKKWYLELNRCALQDLKATTNSESGECHNVQLKTTDAGNSAVLSFVTAYKSRVLHVVVYSSVGKRPRDSMPSAVSADNSIRVSCSIFLPHLADSIALCISKHTDTYTMLAEAVWDNMEKYCCDNPE